MALDLAWLKTAFPGVSSVSSIQEGGQKWVFSLEDSAHGSCVLKLLKPGANLYIDREIEVLNRIPAVVPTVYATGLVDSPLGKIIFVLEQRIEGETLFNRLLRGPCSKEETISITSDLLTTAVQAEAQNIVHRDIKPKNIILDPTGKAWLIDFGIARVLDLESRTGTEASTGPHSPGYSAPEQFRYQKRKIDGRADLFAIGVVSYEAISGINPFMTGAADVAEILMRVEKMPLPRLNLDWDLGGVWSDMISSFTQKFPHQRPFSVAAAEVRFKQVLLALET